MVFRVTSNVHVERDLKEGKIRHISHLYEPYKKVDEALAASPETPQSLANQYIREVAPLYDIKPEMLTDLTAQQPRRATFLESESAAKEKLHVAEEKSIMGTTVVSYSQNIDDIPIFQAGLSVVINEGRGVTSSNSSIHHNIKLNRPGPNAKFMPDLITPELLAKILNLDGVNKKKKGQKPIINSSRLVIYQYDPKLRLDPEIKQENKGKDSETAFHIIPTIPLPPVPTEIEPGTHYIATEVLFTLPRPRGREINWRGIIEAETGAFLFLRAAVACVTGMIYRFDPRTYTGDVTITPASPSNILDPLRNTVVLPGIRNPQALSGEFVQLVNRFPPDSIPPIGNFSHSVPTDDFAAVNAYYHSDAVFRMVKDMGFDIDNYFDGTTFPVSVDHRSNFGEPKKCPLGNCVNAQAPGNRTLTGSDGFDYALALKDNPVGIAVDWRVVLHEFGHALLWDNVHWANFGFAHSAGDSLAAILCDAQSRASDRFETFPWIPAIAARRRHDRKVSDWAWGSKVVLDEQGFLISGDDRNYGSEQILSTTLFRIYRSLGGDSNSVSIKKFASRYVAYLIIRAIGSLASDPITQTDTPDIFATALMNADIATANFEGNHGGFLHKVIRWSFEKQGLYQLPDARRPVTTEGAPPEVDVFIDDGRKGEYSYLSNFWNAPAIWNRIASDGGTIHQPPKLGSQNYVYVRVNNRGIQAANNVVIKGYHSKVAVGLVFPDDWQPMTTPQISLSESIVPGGEVIAGPFKWTPDSDGEENLLMTVSADGDPNNADIVDWSFPNWLLVPFDNNIAQKNLSVLPGGSGSSSLTKSFDRNIFWINNPYDHRTKVVLEPIIPHILSERNCRVRFLNSGGSSFTLGPGTRKEITIGLESEEDFTSSDLEGVGGQECIDIVARMDEVLVGGKSYLINSKMKTSEDYESIRIGRSLETNDTVKHVLDNVKLPYKNVKSVKLKGITVNIEMEDT